MYVCGCAAGILWKITTNQAVRLFADAEDPELFRYFTLAMNFSRSTM